MSTKKFEIIQIEERHVIRRPIEVNGLTSEIKCTGVLNTERGTYKVSCPVTTRHTDRNNEEITKATFELQRRMMAEMSDFMMERVKDLNLEGGDSNQMQMGFGGDADTSLYATMEQAAQYEESVQNSDKLFPPKKPEGRPLRKLSEGAGSKAPKS